MALTAFVACKKDGGNNPGGKCTCYALGKQLTNPDDGSVYFDLGPLSSCAELAQISTEAMGGYATVTCYAK